MITHNIHTVNTEYLGAIYSESSINCTAGENGPAALVLAGPVFSIVKLKSHFYKKQVIYKSTSMIFGLIRLIILSYNR